MTNGQFLNWFWQVRKRNQYSHHGLRRGRRHQEEGPLKTNCAVRIQDAPSQHLDQVLNLGLGELGERVPELRLSFQLDGRQSLETCRQDYHAQKDSHLSNGRLRSIHGQQVKFHGRWRFGVSANDGVGLKRRGRRLWPHTRPRQQIDSCIIKESHRPTRQCYRRNFGTN